MASEHRSGETVNGWCVRHHRVEEVAKYAYKDRLQSEECFDSIKSARAHVMSIVEHWDENEFSEYDTDEEYEQRRRLTLGLVEKWEGAYLEILADEDRDAGCPAQAVYIEPATMKVAKKFEVVKYGHQQTVSKSAEKR